MSTPHSAFCTLNFLFRGSDGHRYIGTAGHCVVDSGRRVWRGRSGPLARNGDGGSEIGHVVYAAKIKEAARTIDDFALIRLRPGVDASPEMCSFRGPTGIDPSRPVGAPVVLNFSGYGLAYGSGAGLPGPLPQRTAIANGMPDRRHVYAEGVAAPGDSGAGVLGADGRAVGLLVTGGVHSDQDYASNLHVGTIGIMRLRPQIRAAETALGIDLRLVTV